MDALTRDRVLALAGIVASRVEYRDQVEEDVEEVDDLETDDLDEEADDEDVEDEDEDLEDEDDDESDEDEEELDDEDKPDEDEVEVEPVRSAADRDRLIRLLPPLESRMRQADNTGSGAGGTGKSQDQSKHPHVTSGPKGGQFTTHGGGGSKAAPKAKSAPSSVPQAPATPRTMKQGDSGEDVRYAQYAMSLLGFKVNQNGTYDTQTAAAVKEIQSRLGMAKPNGHLSASQLHKLQDAVRLSPCVGQSRSFGQDMGETRDLDDDTESRHRALVLLGIPVRALPPDDDDTIDDETRTILEALDEWVERQVDEDWEERAHDVSAELRIPGGHGGGRWTKNPIGKAISDALDAWGKGKGPDDPFVVDGKPIDREPLRKAAVARGITLKRGAPRDDIVKALKDGIKGEVATQRAERQKRLGSAKFSIDVGGKAPVWSDFKAGLNMQVPDSAPELRFSHEIEGIGGRRVPPAEVAGHVDAWLAGPEGPAASAARLTAGEHVPGTHWFPNDPEWQRSQEIQILHEQEARWKEIASRLRKAPPITGGKRIDVALYRADSKPDAPILREISSANRPGRVITSQPDLAGLEQWANDNGHGDVAQWAASERARAEAKSAPRTWPTDNGGRITEAEAWKRMHGDKPMPDAKVPAKKAAAKAVKGAPGAAVKRLSASDLAGMTGDEVAQAFHEGRVSRPAAVRQIRGEASFAGRAAAARAAGLADDDPKMTADNLVQIRASRERAARLNALADAIEAPAKTSAPAAPGAAKAVPEVPKVAAKRVPKVAKPGVFDPAATAEKLRGAPSEAEAIRLLASDPSLTAVKLRKVAAELNIDVPPDMRSKGAMQLHIAEKVATGRGLPSAALPSTPHPDGLDSYEGPRLKSYAAEFLDSTSGMDDDQIRAALRAQGVGSPAIEREKRIAEAAAAPKADGLDDLATGSLAGLARDNGIDVPWPPLESDRADILAKLRKAGIRDLPEDVVQQRDPVEQAFIDAAPARERAAREVLLVAAQRAGGIQISPTMTGRGRQDNQRLDDLRRDGLMRREGDSYHLTDAGRAEAARLQAQSAPKVKAGPSLADVQLDNRILDLYRSWMMQGRPGRKGDALPLEDLRQRMKDVSPEQFDAAVQRLTAHGATVTPDGIRVTNLNSVPLPARDWPKLSSNPAERLAQVQDRIEKTYRELATRQGEFASHVGLADVRDRLGPDVSRNDFDRAVIDMSRRPEVTVPTEANTKSLTPRDRAASVSIGNQDRHLIRIAPPAGGARPTPGGTPPPVRVSQLFRNTGGGPPQTYPGNAALNHAQLRLRAGDTPASVAEGLRGAARAMKQQRLDEGDMQDRVSHSASELKAIRDTEVRRLLETAKALEAGGVGPKGEGGTKTGAAALAAAPVGMSGFEHPTFRGLDSLTPAQRKMTREALLEYQHGDFEPINDVLRNGPGKHKPGDVKRYEAQAARLSAAIDSSPLASDVETWRGLGTGQSIFGPTGDWPADLTGRSWTDGGFVSTSTDRAGGGDFAGGVLMRLTAPAGTPAVQMSGADHESELLLGTGHSFRVVADHGPTEVPDGKGGTRKVKRLLDVEIVPSAARPKGEGAPKTGAAAHITGPARVDAPAATPAPSIEATPEGPGVANAGSSSPHEGLAAAIQRPVTHTEALSQGFMATTSLVTHAGGVKVVEKKFDRNDAASYRDPVQQADAEVLSSLVARAIGAKTPETVRADSGEVPAVKMEYVHGRPGAQIVPKGQEHAPDSITHTDEGRRLGLLDVLVGNQDRNLSNWIVGDNGELTGIDHGAAWGADAPGLNDFTRYLENDARNHFADHNDLSKADMAALEQRLQALKPRFEQVHRTDWWEAMMRRLQLVSDRASGTRRILP